MNFKDMIPSKVLYINCMQLQTPDALFKHLCEALGVTKKGSVGKVNSEKLLRKFLAESKPTQSSKNPGRKLTKAQARKLQLDSTEQKGMIVLIADEIDRLRTTDNHVLYSLFELSAIPNSPLILLTIANALDMTDRILPRLLNSHCMFILLPNIHYGY